MKMFIFFAMVLSTATAMARPDTTKMTCSAAAHLVASSGAIVLSSGDGIYDRYVSNQSYCQRDETTQAAWVETKDNGQCFIGYTCTENEHHGGMSAHTPGILGNARPMACVEGQEQVIYEQDENGHEQRNLYICRSGRWVREF